MQINNLQNATRLPLDIQAYSMFNQNELEIIHLCLVPGQEIPLHSNPFDVIACAISGEVILLTENEQSNLQLYSTAYIPKNILRGMKNIGNQEARLLMVKQIYTIEK